MSNSQEQSLNKDAVFLPLYESSPEFLHCERERNALECLMNAGPGAYYTRVRMERLAAFLSQQEVSQISDWAQDYSISKLQVEVQENGGEEGSSGMQDFSSRYFPTHSDTPAPCLELGWPERNTWVGRGQVMVHTSPPAEGQSPLREIIRRHLQGASKVIAIVTDKLTDSSVIGDLHTVASRGVPVYVILNQRSIHENFTPTRLRHPNIQVRVLGGKTFYSREGKMVVGEMKNNFILVDLDTVIHGSYSLTWSDAHLHRQLVTVLNGPVVESFDQEFRILFAASLPVPDTYEASRPQMDVPYHSEFLVLDRPRYLPSEPDLSPPPPPQTDSPLDWEALGVIKRDYCFPESPVNHHVEPIKTEEPPQPPMPLGKKTPVREEPGPREFNQRRTTPLNEPRTGANTTFVTRNHLDNQARQPSQTDVQRRSTETESQQRVQRKIELSYLRQRSSEEERKTDKPTENKMETNSRQKPVAFSPSQRRDWTIRRQNNLKEELKEDVAQSQRRAGLDSQSSSRKPLILRVPQSENFSSLSDIMKRLQPQQSFPAPERRGTKTTVSALSRSMMDLSVKPTDTSREERGPRVPKLQTSYFDPERVTPALALMRKRNDEIKYGPLKTPQTFTPNSRTRGASPGVQRDWRKPQIDQDRDSEERK